MDLEKYNRDGYWVAKDLLTGAARFDNSGLREHYQKIFDTNVVSYIATLSGAARSANMHAMFVGTEVISHLPFCDTNRTINVLVSTQPVVHVMCRTLEITGGYNGTAAHQDWASTQGSLDSITVWVPLTPTKNNFPLEVIPGSHLNGLLPGKMNGSVLEVEADDSKFVPVDCEVGDVVFLSGFLVHRTGKGTDGFRMASSIRFDNADEPTFRERNFYSAQKRVVDREIKWQPSVEQVRKVFHVG